MRTRMPRWRAWFAVALWLLPLAARASLMSPEVERKVATYVAWFVVIAMPIGGIVLFWMVHVLPEKFAEKRHHPQAQAIQVLCLLSLVFGGLLWPIAWLWAFTKPTHYRQAYGTDKSDEYFVHMAEAAEKGEVRGHALQAVIDELEGVAARNALSAELREARDRLVRVAGPAAAGGAT
jgi:CBS domain containing-hemolysin-like protein